MKNVAITLAATFALALAVVSPNIAQSIAASTSTPAHETLKAFTIDEALAQCETLDIEYKSDCVDAAHATIWE